MNTETLKGINPLSFLPWLLMGVIAIVIFQLLRKFNLLGKSEETKEAEKLGTDPAFSDVITNAIIDKTKPFGAAIKAKFGPKPTPEQLLSLLPNKDNIPKWVTTIMFDVHKVLTPNNAALIFNVFKSLRSQYEINFFSSVYAAQTKEDMYKRLDKLMKDSDMMKLREMINKKPII